MYIEKRKNGAFYLKSSVYNPVTKLPKNTSTYLGSNPIQAKEKLKALTDDKNLLDQIPDVTLYEYELMLASKALSKLNVFNTKGLNKILQDCLTEVLNAEKFICSAHKGKVFPTIDCPWCRFKKANFCCFFDKPFMNGNGKNENGHSIRCIVYEPIEVNSKRGTIKLPGDFKRKE